MNNITDQKAIVFFERIAFIEVVREAETAILQNTLELLRMCFEESDIRISLIKEELLIRLRAEL